MRVKIGNTVHPELTAAIEVATNAWRQENRVAGTVMTEEQATEAYTAETRQFFVIMAAIAVLLTMGVGLLMGPNEGPAVALVIVLINLLLWGGLYLIFRRRISTWNAALGGRSSGLPPAGTEIVVDDRGLSVGGTIHPWASLRIDQVDMVDFTQRNVPRYFVDRLLLATASEVLVLDAMMIGSGRLMVGNSWRRLRARQ
jgi:hypothetical protein